MKAKYFIFSIARSFVGLVILTAVVKYGIWENIPDQYDLFGTILGVLVLCFGVVCIGYLNAKNTLENNLKQSFYVHFILAFLMFITDVVFGKAEIYVAVLRNLGYLAVLQFGAYIFVKKIIFKKPKA